MEILEEVQQFPVKYCTICSKVYEMVFRKGIEYYVDFPTYGLERETCCNCK